MGLFWGAGSIVAEQYNYSSGTANVYAGISNNDRVRLRAQVKEGMNHRWRFWRLADSVGLGPTVCLSLIAGAAGTRAIPPGQPGGIRGSRPDAQDRASATGKSSRPDHEGQGGPNRGEPVAKTAAKNVMMLLVGEWCPQARCCPSLF